MSGLIKCFNTRCRDFSRDKCNNCARPLQLIQECSEGVVRREHSAEGMGQGKGAESSRLKAERQEKRDKLWYIREFRSNECTCGNTKRPGSAFCSTCFMKLPCTYRMATYQRMGEGYEEAYENAVQWLREQE
jgi:hypothetical protein